jgi:uncharacterized protein YqjF (DUF2071 family)
VARLFMRHLRYHLNSNAMDALKTLPIAYTGELHEVQLVAFSVPTEEVISNLPDHINPVIENGRALFSMVSVELKKMKANVLPIGFNYKHVAIRMCVNDSQYNKSNENQGIYFYQSFADKPTLVAGGKLMTAYNLETASFKTAGNVFEVKSKEHYMQFAIDKSTHKIGDAQLYQKIQRLDRAYFNARTRLYRTCITRSEWPIKWADCYAFETNLFKDVKIEGAFYIEHPILYKWNAPVCVNS